MIAFVCDERPLFSYAADAVLVQLVFAPLLELFFAVLFLLWALFDLAVVLFLFSAKNSYLRKSIIQINNQIIIIQIYK